MPMGSGSAVTGRTRGRNERAALAFLRAAGLKVEDDPRAASLLSGAIALDGSWSATGSRELRLLRAELAEYLPVRQPAAPVVEKPVGELPAPVSIVDRLRRPS